MAARRPRLPIGGGDSIVVWRSAARWIGLYFALIALFVLFVLAIVTSYLNQPATAGRIASQPPKNRLGSSFLRSPRSLEQMKPSNRPTVAESVAGAAGGHGAASR